jgi:hypothetical protein
MASYKKPTFGNFPFNHLNRIAGEEATRAINLIGPEAEPEIRRVAVVGRLSSTPEQRVRGERGSPRFRVIGSNLEPGEARSAARRWPSVCSRYFYRCSNRRWSICRTPFRTARIRSVARPRESSGRGSCTPLVRQDLSIG